MAVPPRRLDPGDDSDGWYSRCPRCALIGPVISVEYFLTAAMRDGEADGSMPVVLGCVPCGHTYSVVLTDLRVLDAEHMSSRSKEVTLVPADRLRWCAGLAACAHSVWPHLLSNSLRMRYVDATWNRHAVQLRDKLLQAR